MPDSVNTSHQIHVELGTKAVGQLAGGNPVTIQPEGMRTQVVITMDPKVAAVIKDSIQPPPAPKPPGRRCGSGKKRKKKSR